MAIFTDNLQVGDRLYTVEAADPRDVPSMALDRLITFVRTGHWPKIPAKITCAVDPGGLIANKQHLPERVWEIISPVVYKAMAARKRLEWINLDDGCRLRVCDEASLPRFAAAE